MVFRRPRVNVKPNVQTARPVGSTVQSQDTLNEVVSTPPQEEQSIQQIELPIVPPIIKGRYRSMKIGDKLINVYCILEPISDVEEITDTPSSLPAPPSPPAPQSILPARPLFRKKIVPNFGGVKANIHHRR